MKKQINLSFIKRTFFGPESEYRTVVKNDIYDAVKTVLFAIAVSAVFSVISIICSAVTENILIFFISFLSALASVIALFVIVEEYFYTRSIKKFINTAGGSGSMPYSDLFHFAEEKNMPVSASFYVKDGAPVYAVAGGTVSEVTDDNYNYGFGYQVKYVTTGGWCVTVSYCMSDLKPGDIVEEGAIIGYSTKSGISDGNEIIVDFDMGIFK